MGSQRVDYHYLNFRGKLSPPNSEQVKNADSKGIPFQLILDNNICIHVSDLYRPSLDKIKKTKANNFLNYCGVSHISILPLGLVERSSEPGTLDFNTEKLAKYENDFWRKLQNYSDNNGLSSAIPDITPLKTILYPIYAYLLKIKLILLEREPSQANLRKNITDLYDFSQQLGINLTLPLQLAFAVFGGHSKSQKLINKKEEVLKGLWGATWDLYYVQFIHQYNGIRELNNCKPQLILVTDDNACSTIGDLAKVSSFIDYGDGGSLYHNVEVSSDFPHFESNTSFLHEITMEINHKVIERSSSRSSMSEAEQQNSILEIIRKSDSFIQRATKEIEFNQRKGFA